MKKHLLLAIFALSSFSGILPMSWDFYKRPIFRSKSTGKLIINNLRFPLKVQKTEKAPEKSEIITATDLYGNNSLQNDLAANNTFANRDFVQKLYKLDEQEWQSWQKAFDGQVCQFSLPCVDYVKGLKRNGYHAIRVDAGSPHFKDRTFEERNCPNRQDILETWNAVENELFHDELQFLQTQQLVIERNLCQAQGSLEEKHLQQNLSDLEQHIIDFTHKDNREAFARSHVPSKYFKPLKVARLNFELDQDLELRYQVRENAFVSMPNSRKRTMRE